MVTIAQFRPEPLQRAQCRSKPGRSAECFPLETDEILSLENTLRSNPAWVLSAPSQSRAGSDPGPIRVAFGVKHNVWWAAGSTPWVQGGQKAARAPPVEARRTRRLAVENVFQKTLDPRQAFPQPPSISLGPARAPHHNSGPGRHHTIVWDRCYPMVVVPPQSMV